MEITNDSYCEQQETERLMADPAPGISAVPHDDNLRYFNVAITGPEGSPFERMFCIFCHIMGLVSLHEGVV